MIGSLSYEKIDEKINAEEVLYWKRMIKSNLKIGVEIETNLSTSVSSYDVRSKLTSIFNPTNSFGIFGRFGVLTIKGDGSLDNGIELCTIGRRVNYIDLYNQYNAIITQILKHSPIMNERAGLHNHILMDYGNNYNSLEKSMPGIILKNFIQLIKRHMPELVYLTSTVKSNNAITRMDKFCSADTLIRTTPLNKKINEFKARATEDGNGRYKFVNLRPMVCNGNEITTFHMELRFPDGSLYPAQIAAQNILYASILLKAVELSEIGAINCGNSDLWEETKTLYNAIRNSNAYDRKSIAPTTDQLTRIKERCHDMLLEFKPQIDSYDIHTYRILDILKETPISILRRTKTDKEINTMFDEIIVNMYSNNLEDCNKIIELINLNKIIGAYSENDWFNKAAAIVNETAEIVKSKVFKLTQYKNVYFEKELGSFAFK